MNRPPCCIMRFSVIIPVYNRPDELSELLDSLSAQPRTADFEVIVVDDGSSEPCRDVAQTHQGLLDISYFFIPNGGPGAARNYGAARAKGEYLIFLDSDTIVPEGYFDAVERGLAATVTDAFGGPDKAHPSFSDTQKAINYSMTSFLTTGGIRGGKKRIDHFYPRSFNMGIRAEAYRRTGGFSNMRFGEDIDLSLRLIEEGFKTALFADAWVYHKRRTDFRKFFRQVMNSGIARINLHKRHPGSLKLVHLLPMVFTVGVIFLLLLFVTGFVFGATIGRQYDPPFGGMISGVALLPLVLYSLLVFVDSSLRNRSMKIGLLCIRAAFTQLMGYGLGFLLAWFRRCVLGRDEFSVFGRSFYK